jgi:DNA-binding LytR/AlgR family response regulator
MIKALLIEDEIPARKKLLRFLNDVEEPVEIVAEIDTIEKAITFLKDNPVDIIFSDIELLDGQAFQIYEQVQVNCPIIFTTAYDQFWMNAFETNGIEYLLKPFSFERFQKAWNKFLKFQKTQDNDIVTKLSQLLKTTQTSNTYKKRFAVNTNNGFYFLDTANITLFSAEEGVVFAYDTTGKKHLLTENTLKTIENQLDPIEIFKINRGEIIIKQHIEKVERYSKNSVALKVKAFDKHLIVSQSNTPTFRIWLEK